MEQYREQNQARPLLWTVLLLLLAQLLSLYFPLADYLRPFVSQSLGVHTLMEGFSIVISALVFAVGWSVYQKENSAGFLMLACCFLGVAVLDLMHTLSFSGMPAFITESDPEKAIAFWLMARGFAAIGLVMGWLLPNRPITPVSRALMLSVVLLYIGLSCWLVFFHQDWLPRTFDAVDGLTSFKKTCEYVLAGVYAVSAIGYLRQTRRQHTYDPAGLAAAAAIMAMSELFATFYASVSDLYILLGHAYKLVAYGLIYRSVFLNSIQLPYQRLYQAHQALSVSEAKFHAIIEESPIAYALHDSQGNISYLNSAFVKTFGYTLGDIPTLAEWWWHAHPDAEYRQQVIANWHTYQRVPQSATESGQTAELKVCCKDGRCRMVLVDIVLLGDSLAGNQLLILRDISERLEAMHKLADSVNMLQTVINTIPSRVFWKDLNYRYLGANLAFSQDAGLENPAELIGKSDEQLVWRDLAHLYRADDKQVIESNTAKLNYEETLMGPAGKTMHLRTSRVPLRNLQQQTIGVLGVYEDITARKSAEEEMQLAALVYLNSSEAMMVTDATGTIITVNPAFTTVTGYSADEVIGRAFVGTTIEPHDQAFYKTVLRVINTHGQWAGEISGRRKNGEDCIQWVTINSILNENGGVHRRVALIADITERKKSEELIWRQANFDPLTGLPNRNMFLDRLNQEIKKAFRHGRHVALMFLDLDRFKDVNDSMGHFMGDILLKEAARRISGCVRDCDSIARLGGDEFTVILGELDQVDGVNRIARNILQALAEPFRLGNETAYISGSIGIALYPDDALDTDSLLKNADQAMYAAKNQGRDRYQYFTALMQQNAQLRMRLANDLHGALARQQFLLHYQPIIEFASGSIAKAEALLRWLHPTLGMVSPAEFIPVAEDTGVIVDIGDWVFDTAAHQAKQWRQTYHPDFQISVNKSPVQFRRQAMEANQWLALLQELDLPGQSVIVEITEGLILDASNSTREQLSAFRDGGMQVALDDFGTGYSSLAYLKKFDIDYIKIDQAFVRSLVAGSSDMALCEAIVVMAHKLGIKVVAEGIETQEQYDLLNRMGCDYGQGYLISKPVPADQFEQLLDKAFTQAPSGDGRH
ncbi:EAL domain-containing protein [Methylomonas sp. OY6]|uniref:EAL domain-containing protein n=1 Tax=Methylomonas defluvii TaxID=3045149 RepID=A0ABU4U9Z3_9GAMM|nr:EAL domain-containing protein [Methylomonas sp. OY6]MDX8126256.1 EAL domain-containing protein [Methylomonas sp. OY6]